MNAPFDLNIGTRKITVTPAENTQIKGSVLTGTFALTEGDTQKGTIRFDQKAWENKDTDDLSYVELEAIAEAIAVQYQ